MGNICQFYSHDFVDKGLQDYNEQGGNVTGSFERLAKRYGRDYIQYLQDAYAAKGDMSDHEFAAINGNVPNGMIKKIKKQLAASAPYFTTLTKEAKDE